MSSNNSATSNPSRVPFFGVARGGTFLFWACAIALVCLVVWAGYKLVHNDSGSVAPNVPVSNTAPAARLAKALPPSSGIYTLDPVTYHVETDAVFDAKGPKKLARCLWPAADSSAYSRVDLVTDAGTFSYVNGVPPKDKPDDGIRYIHVWAKDGKPVDATIQKQHWGSNCPQPTDADTERQAGASDDP